MELPVGAATVPGMTTKPPAAARAADQWQALAESAVSTDDILAMLVQARDEDPRRGQGNDEYTHGNLRPSSNRRCP